MHIIYSMCVFILDKPCTYVSKQFDIVQVTAVTILTASGLIITHCAINYKSAQRTSSSKPCSIRLYFEDCIMLKSDDQKLGEGRGGLH